MAKMARLCGNSVTGLEDLAPEQGIRENNTLMIGSGASVPMFFAQ